MGSLLRTWTLASATLRDLARRPGALLALAATGVLVTIVPRLSRRALDDGAALGIELVLSTTWLYAGVFAALVGARAAAAGASLGLTAELLATPLGRGEYIVGRAAGIAAAASLHAAALLAIGACALLLSGHAQLDHGAIAAAALGGVAQIVLLTAAGLAAGTLLGGQMGAVAIVAYLVASRVLVPHLTATGTAWTWWLPDPLRLDVSREAAFGRVLGARAVAAAIASAALQACALLVVALIALGTDADTDRQEAA